MKSYSTPINNHRSALRQFYAIDLLSFRVRDRTTGDLLWRHFSSRRYNETIAVTNQSTGALENRNYVGGGTIVEVPSIVRSEGTVLRSFTLTLSGTSPAVLDLVQGYDCRDAPFEWHVGEATDDTGLLIDAPVCEFEGFVDTIDREDDAIAFGSGEPADSNFKLKVTSHVSTLSRANPDMRSFEVGTERSDDAIFRHSDASNTWKAQWGREGRRRSGNNTSGRNGDSPTKSDR